ncbi:hypothetical protein PROFUN_13464 [Planoprotostelium fungivorum]|uniref:Uncharacterized protein n=1 Tax=Planoprotostelium fungivorum TaxID=1890364 RepID=A0A2P6N3T4_9EUKA|nr:hypothetical protein PROFUN_13464 [Planoprotostelium fungivorum]
MEACHIVHLVDVPDECSSPGGTKYKKALKEKREIFFTKSALKRLKGRGTLMCGLLRKTKEINFHGQGLQMKHLYETKRVLFQNSAHKAISHLGRVSAQLAESETGHNCQDVEQYMLSSVDYKEQREKVELTNRL